MHTAYEDLEDPVYDALQTLHDVSDAVKETAPAVAFEMSESEIDLHHRPVVRAGAAFGSRLELPVEDAKFSELCGHAGELPLGLAQSALTDAKIPALPQLMGSLKKPMHSLTEKFSSWFCGDGGGDSSAAPTHKEKLRRSYPRVETESSRACEAGDGLSGAEGPVGEATSLACEKAQAEEAAGKPDDRTGACRAGTDCSIGGPYEKRVALAREQCDPTLSPKPVAYWYQARKGRVAYEWTGRMWKRGVPRYEQAVRRAGKDGQGEKKPPCGPLSVNPSVAPGYQLSPHPNGNVEEIAPVCSTEVAPPPAGFRLQSGTIEYREFTEVTHILGCVREMEETIPIEVGDRARDGGSSRAPKAVESRSHLGGESFQIRAVIEGNTRVMRSIEAVRLALWGKPVHEDPSQGELKPFVALAVAQAEYFYDAPDGRGAWMWNMKWRARLRRFRVPESAAQELVAACSRVGSGQSCASALTLARGSLFSH
jgi:hypothetical protein